MAAYKVYRGPHNTYEAVKQGWSWLWFFFGPLWALFKRMWSIGFGLIVALFFLLLIRVSSYGFLKDASQIVFPLVVVLLPFVLGTIGNRWHERYLLAHDFRWKATYEADNFFDAIDLYKEERRDEIRATRREAFGTPEERDIYGTRS